MPWNWQLKLQLLSSGHIWLDNRTHEALADAKEFVKVVEKRPGLKLLVLKKLRCECSS